MAAVGSLLLCVAACATVSASILLDGASAASERGSGEEAERKSVTIAWVGDITLGSRYGLPPDGGDALFASVRSTLRGPDLALGNLEGTLSVGGASKCGADGGNCFSFQAPPANARALRRAGFDVLNLANNHAFDFGPEGQRQTVAALRAEGLATTGRPAELTVESRGGVRVAVVGFAPYPWANDVRDLVAVRALVTRASARADVVVVLAHIGGEGSEKTRTPVGTEIAMGENRGDTRAFAHAAVDAGADLVLGSGPHVLRGLEVYRGRLVAYSLGNFAGWHNFSTAGALGLSGVLTVRVGRDGRPRRGELRSLRLSGAGVPHPDASQSALQLVRQVGALDFGRGALRLRDDGRFCVSCAARAGG